MLSVPSFLKINTELVEEKIVKCIKEYVDSTGAKGVVLGLSGGVDSSTVLALCVKALGSDRVRVLLMPDKETSQRDLEDAMRIASMFNVRKTLIDITSQVEQVLKDNGSSYEEEDKVVKGNVKARIRMINLYYHANKYSLLVIGASDKSEYELGYFTKWGDAAADLQPILGLFKTQVRMLALHLGLPEDIALKPSTPGLWPGHRAVDELGMDYYDIDKILYYIVERKIEDPNTISRLTNIPVEKVREIMKRQESARHKKVLNTPYCALS